MHKSLGENSWARFFTAMAFTFTAVSCEVSKPITAALENVHLRGHTRSDLSALSHNGNEQACSTLEEAFVNTLGVELDARIEGARCRSVYQEFHQKFDLSIIAFFGDGSLASASDIFIVQTRPDIKLIKRIPRAMCSLDLECQGLIIAPKGISYGINGFLFVRPKYANGDLFVTGSDEIFTIVDEYHDDIITATTAKKSWLPANCESPANVLSYSFGLEFGTDEEKFDIPPSVDAPLEEGVFSIVCGNESIPYARSMSVPILFGFREYFSVQHLNGYIPNDWQKPEEQSIESCRSAIGQLPIEVANGALDSSLQFSSVVNGRFAVWYQGKFNTQWPNTSTDLVSGFHVYENLGDCAFRELYVQPRTFCVAGLAQDGTELNWCDFLSYFSESLERSSSGGFSFRVRAKNDHDSLDKFIYFDGAEKKFDLTAGQLPEECANAIDENYPINVDSGKDIALVSCSGGHGNYSDYEIMFTGLTSYRILARKSGDSTP